MPSCPIGTNQVNPMKPVYLLTLFLGLVVLSSMVAADPATMIMVSMTVEGPHTHVGDEFLIRGTVTNIGSVPAENVIMHIEGVPPDWQWTIVEPGDFSHILPGQSVERVYHLTNTGGQPNVLLWAWGPNTNTAYSTRIQLPIHPFMMGGLIFAMGGLFLFTRRKKQSHERMAHGVI